MAQRRNGTRRELLIRWKGYGPEHDEWQLRSELIRTAPERVAEYDALQQGISPQAAQAALYQLLLRRQLRLRPSAPVRVVTPTVVSEAKPSRTRLRRCVGPSKA